MANLKDEKFKYLQYFQLLKTIFSKFLFFMLGNYFHLQFVVSSVLFSITQNELFQQIYLAYCIIKPSLNPSPTAITIGLVFSDV